MITEMRKYDFVVHHVNYDLFLAQLQKIGLVHIAKLARNAEAYETLKEKSATKQRIDRLATLCEKLIDENQQQQVGIQIEKMSICTMERVLKTADAIEAHQKSIEVATAAMTMAEREEERMSVWGNYKQDDIDILRKEGYTTGFYNCATRAWQPEWEERWNAVKIEELKGMTYFVTITCEPIGEIEAEQFKMSDKSLAQLHEEATEARKHLDLLKKEQALQAVDNLATLKKGLELIKDEIKVENIHINTEHAADDSVMVLEGYCPEDNVEILETMLASTHGIYWEACPPDAEDNVPIKLHNNRFTRAFEPLTSMYGMPDYQEFDPTPVLAPFFLLFFAMCMGDCGYGLVLILFGLAVKYKKIKIEMFEGLGEIITYLGIGTAIIGFFLGVGFGADLTQVSWIPESLRKTMIVGEVYGYNIQMILALGIGVFHICLAMVIKAIGYTKRYGFAATVSTWGWLLLILGGIAIAAIIMSGFATIESAKIAIIAIAAISALGIYVFNDPRRNILINIGAGLWDTYNMATGLLGDVLSYIRLFALGLAGGMLGGAFNNLASMILGDEPNILLYIPFVLILLFGHVLNLGMSALGAFVHPLRLTFVEYFKNSGYNGKGEKYDPFN